MRFRTIIGIAVMLGMLAWALGAAQALSDRERELGFVDLFNGKDLSGWTVMGEPAAWKVENGILRCTGEGYGWLRSNLEYEDFIWRLEYKISKDGNSGMFIRALLDGNPAFSGMELQIMDDCGRPADTHTSCALYDAVAPKENMSLPAGEWNTVEIACVGPHLTVRHNGIKVIDTRLDDPALNARMSEDRKLIKRAKSGFIGLQNHHTPVEFRNLRIKKYR